MEPVRPSPASAGAPAPLVYVVLLNWHGWRDTLVCLRSLAGLDYPRFVTVVVDNGSTDESVARIREASPQAEVIETGKNLGFSGGCNVGISVALERGADYVWLLNNDTTVEPGTLEAMVRTAERDACIGAVGSVIRYMARPECVQAWGGGKVHVWLGYQRLHTSRPAGRDLHYLTAASLLLRRAVVLELGGLDIGYFMYWEDVDYCFSMRRRGWRLQVAEDAVVLHKESGSTERASPVRVRYFSTSAVRFFRRHSPLPALAITLGLVGRVVKRLPTPRRWPEIGASLRGAAEGYRRHRKGLPA
jgi:GT2 family glycosyltransferase